MQVLGMPHLVSSLKGDMHAGILPKVKKCNVYTPKLRPSSRQLLSSASPKHQYSSNSHAAGTSPASAVSLAEKSTSKARCHRQNYASNDKHHRKGADPHGMSQVEDQTGHHLAALQGLFTAEWPLQSVIVSNSKHLPAPGSNSLCAQRVHTRGGLAPAQHAGVQRSSLPAVQIGMRRKQAVDMFGLGLNENLQGKAVGLSIPRPVSSFW